MKNTNAKHGTQKHPGKPLLPPRKQEYVYHWDRIIGVGVVFLVLVGLTGYGLFLWSDSSPKEEFDMAEPLPKAEVAVENTQPRLEEALIRREIEEDPRSFTHAEEDRLPPADAETTDSSSNSQDTQTQLLDEAIIAEDNSAQQFAENQPLEPESPSPEMAHLSTANHTNEETVEETLVNEMDLEDSEPAYAAQPPEEMPAIPIQEGLSEPQTEIPQNIPLEPQGESPDSADTTLTVDTINVSFRQACLSQHLLMKYDPAGRVLSAKILLNTQVTSSFLYNSRVASWLGLRKGLKSFSGERPDTQRD